MSLSESWAIIAVLLSMGSLLIAYKAYGIAAFHALPHPEIGWLAKWGGTRSLDFEITRPAGGPAWVIESASIRRNWRRQRYLARGSLQDAQEVDGEIIREYEPIGPWEHRIIFDPPVTRGALVLHTDTPDCQLKLRITLSTLPSPTIVRRIKLSRYGPQSHGAK